MAGLCQVYYFLREQRHTRKLKIYLIKLFKHVCYLFSLLIKISGLKYNYFPLKKTEGWKICTLQNLDYRSSHYFCRFTGCKKCDVHH